MPTKTIWLIDDDHIFKMLIKKTILKENLFDEVVEFDDAEDAWNQLSDLVRIKGNLPHVIYLDINMPRKDGWQFLNDFQMLDSETKSRINVYLISSSVFQDDKNQSDLYPFLAGFLIKPIDPKYLVEASKKSIAE